jgi:hypothetical protein
MSALGQKRTYAPQQAMSALPPIATAKADIRAARGHVGFTPKAEWKYSILDSHLPSIN